MPAYKSEMLSDTLTKVPEITLVFWIVKIAATTLGETGGDSVTMTLNWGYLIGTAIFLGALIILVTAQILAKRFHAFLYQQQCNLPVAGYRRRFERLPRSLSVFAPETSPNSEI